MKKLITAAAIAGTFAIANSAHAANSATKITTTFDVIGNTTGATSDPTLTTVTASGTSTTYTVIDLNGGTLTLDGEYVLDNITFIEDGILKIGAGSIIRGEPRSSATKNDPGSLVITRTARIDAQGTAASPIIFTTAALDNDGDTEADGVSWTVSDFNTDDWYFSKSADQWSSTSDTFLDIDPVSSPLAPTDSFSTDVAGTDFPVVIVDNDNNDYPDTATSYSDFEYRSLWGGVIILGSAPTSIGLIVDSSPTTSGGLSVQPTTKGDLASNVLDDIYEAGIEGIFIADVGKKAVYGGDNPNDNSGVMKYVSIRHGGSAIGSANEINGLTLGGVGRGTLIEFIEVYCNGDDGYEFFGGTVDTKYLVSLWNNDDSFDIDEGFTGRGQFWFSLQGDDTFNGDHAGEHDGTDAAYDSVDVGDFGKDDNGGGLTLTSITVFNATYIGGGTNGNAHTDSGLNNAFRIRDSFGGHYYNSIFSDFKSGGIRIDNDNKGRNAKNDVSFVNNIFYGDGAAFSSFTNVYSSKNDTSVDGVGVDPYSLSSKGNIINIDPFKKRREGVTTLAGSISSKFDRRGLYNGGVGFDPRPDDGQTGVTTATGEPATFFTNVGYKGAFDPTFSASNIWTGTPNSTTNPAWGVFGLKYQDLQ